MPAQTEISIIIPARDEERCLPACLTSIKCSAARVIGEIEIIVVLNRCTDRTEEIALAAGARIVREDGKNLALIRNKGIEAARGRVVVTVDADSVVSPGMLPAIERAMQSGRVIGGGVLMLPERYSLGIIATFLCLVPIALRHRISGGLFFCTKADFEAVGGFNSGLHSAEDIDFAKRLKAFGKTQGKKFKTIFNAYIVTSCRKFDRLGDWYFIKNPRNFLRLLGGKDQKLADSIWYDFPRDSGTQAESRETR